MDCRPIEGPIYITRWALTKGILEVDNAEIDLNGFLRFEGVSWMSRAKVPRQDWFTLRAEAIERANDLRLRKIRSLEKKIAQLNGIEW